MKRKLFFAFGTLLALNAFSENFSAEEVTQKYLSALQELDYDSFYLSIYPKAREVGELEGKFMNVGLF